MRGAYLNPSEESSGCRGGVSSLHDDYELEIGNGKNASAEMLALCVHYDELMQYLKLSDCPIAQLLLRSVEKETKRLKKDDL